MIYCFRCPVCDYRTEVVGRGEYRHPPICNHGDKANFVENQSTYMIRDYRAESAGIQTFTSALGDGKVETRVVDGPESPRQ